MNLFARFFCMLFLILCSGFVLVGQTFITNTTPIDEKRYSEYGGTPYLFKVHKTVDLYLTGDSKPYSVDQGDYYKSARRNSREKNIHHKE